MFELIIWIIIICAIYGKAQKRKQQRSGQNYAQPNMQYTRQYQNTASNAQYKQSMQAQGYPQSNYSQADMAAKQRELKQRLQQKYAAQNTAQNVRQNTAGNAPQSMSYNVQSKEHTVQQKPADILGKAAGNVIEYEADMTNNSRLMDEVNDLILMGYQADLTFSRDFVAEGIKMLNSYEISGV